jgi:hypothetical protein
VANYRVKPSAATQSRFLDSYQFPDDARIERIEITKDDLFEFYMFAVLLKGEETVRLIVMWPNEENPYAELT